MFKNRKAESGKPNYMALSVGICLALGVIFAMLVGIDENSSILPIGIGMGMAIGAAVGAMLTRRSRGG
ncbi:MAG: hypothetical protein H6662_14415 [Ardenticatenaceae bacterium]|nr:hypothetical protein [Anaerolineales bacterium]MCB8922778.1 hypothetical protein [Ardenticatenaceae bacterium]MCB9004721.1 hypothetical protein [Ardenticatenaceae bacterium]